MRQNQFALTVVALLGVLSGVTRAAELKLPSVFSSNMILQRDKPVPVWGWSEAGAKVSVEFAGQKKEFTADTQGRWRVTLEALAASARSQKMTVTPAGGKPVTIASILVGDVFLIAGGAEVGRRGADADVYPDEKDVPPVHVFQTTASTAREVQRDARGRWTALQGAQPGTLPAQAIHLGRALAAENGVPVGIVSISIRYPVESWMSREALAAAPEAAPILAFYAGDAWKRRTVGTYEERLKALEYCQKLPLNPPPKPRPDDVDTLAKQEPAGVWNASVAPLVPMALRAILWDGGEDWPSLGRAFQHGQLLPALIADWRKQLGDPALPFAIVELRPHRYATPFGLDSRLAAELREAQRAAVAKAKVAIVPTIDLGADPAPRQVAARIADTIQATVFGKADRDITGPVLVGSESQGDKILLRFNNTRGGLKARGGELKGFAIADSMFHWVWADAKIEGDTVILSAPTITRPQGARYAYEDLPSHGATLTDAAGHPAAPFRTDDHLSLTAKCLDPGAELQRFNPRCDLGIEDPRLPRILIIGDSISGHYLYGVRERLRGKANVIGESSMTKGTWASMGPRFYRSDWASKGDDLRSFLAERGPFHIVHFNNGIHNFSRANPGDEKLYAEQLRKVVATTRAAGAICLFANSTGTVADNTIPNSPRYLTNCRAFNAAAEEVMRELKVPVTDIHGLIQPRIKELISSDLIHTNKEADEMMADLIAKRLAETLEQLPKR